MFFTYGKTYIIHDWKILSVCTSDHVFFVFVSQQKNARAKMHVNASSSLIIQSHSHSYFLFRMFHSSATYNNHSIKTRDNLRNRRRQQQERLVN